MQHIYNRTPTPKIDFNKVAFHGLFAWYGYSPVNLLHIFRTPFPKNSSGWLLLYIPKPNINFISLVKTERKLTKMSQILSSTYETYFSISSFAKVFNTNCSYPYLQVLI